MIKSTRLYKSLVVVVSAILIVALFLPGLVIAQQEDKQLRKSTEVAEKIEARKSKVQKKIEEKRESVEAKSTENRLKACEKRQTKITSSMTRISAQATKHVGTFDKIYERVQSFYEKGQLTVDNYEELNEAVSEAQAQATLEALVLGELDVEVDCSNPDVASTVATYRESTLSAKEALKTYRSTLVVLISSLKAEASQQNNDETEESTTDSTENAESESTTNESEE